MRRALPFVGTHHGSCGERSASSIYVATRAWFQPKPGSKGCQRISLMSDATEEGR